MILESKLHKGKPYQSMEEATRKDYVKLVAETEAEERQLEERKAHGLLVEYCGSHFGWAFQKLMEAAKAIDPKFKMRNLGD